MNRVEWVAVLSDERIVDRFATHVCATRMASGCRVWTGALSAQGSGRFWVSGRHVVVAHRFAFGLRWGVDALLEHPQIAHACDEASCQEPEHMAGSSAWQNTWEWVTRRTSPGSPLRDTRGAYGRAVALRATAQSGGDLDDCAFEGLPEGDRLQDQLPLGLS